MLVTQELARGWMSLAGAMGGHTVVAKLLSLVGTDEQKARYLPPMATGETRATMALTEPGGGSDLQNMTTVARGLGGRGGAGTNTGGTGGVGGFGGNGGPGSNAGGPGGT